MMGLVVLDLYSRDSGKRGLPSSSILFHKPNVAIQIQVNMVVETGTLNACGVIKIP